MGRDKLGRDKPGGKLKAGADSAYRELEQYRKKINVRLRVFLKERSARAAKVSRELTPLMQELADFNTRGGKRIRPAITILSYRAFGGRDESAIIDAALAVELMEGYLLIHDDIIDRDRLRRGKPTMHEAFAGLAAQKGTRSDTRHYGTSLAIIAGDIAAILGSEAIARSDFPAERKIRAIDRFNSVVVNTCFGQVLDIDSQYRTSVSVEDIELVHRLKTAVYTVEGPMHIGAILAGAGDRWLRLLTRVSIPLGQAFQIQDDIQGMFGDEKKIGKPSSSDLKEGKKTHLVIKALENSKKKDAEFLMSCLGKKRVTMHELRRARDIIRRSGSLDYSRELAQAHIRRSIGLIGRSGLPERSKAELSKIPSLMLWLMRKTY